MPAVFSRPGRSHRLLYKAKLAVRNNTVNGEVLMNVRLCGGEIWMKQIRKNKLVPTVRKNMLSKRKVDYDQNKRQRMCSWFGYNMLSIPYISGTRKIFLLTQRSSGGA